MKIPRVVGFRPDDEVREAIENLGARMGSNNLSEIIRVGFIVGAKEISNLPQELVRQWRREGIMAGAAAIKARVESAIKAAHDEVNDGTA